MAKAARRLLTGALLAIATLAPAPAGAASVSTIYSFAGGTNDGYLPQGRLIIDAAGNLYGTTENGGPDCQSEDPLGGAQCFA
jgi:hypothetical protein